MRGRVPVVLAALALVTASARTAAAVEQTPSCAPASHVGGAWPSYGHDLSNTRAQPAEDVIDASSAGALAPRWVFSVSANGEPNGTVQSTPVVANGCVYFGTELGSLFAVNADTGERVWSVKLSSVTGLPLAGNGIVGSVAVADGRVLAMVNSEGAPYAAAFDQDTGALLWHTTVDEYSSSQVNASAVVFDGLFFYAEAGPENNLRGQPKFVILDTADGRILKKTPFIPDEDIARGYGGAGAWGTAVVDTATRYAYVGTTNPYNKAQAHRHANSLLKIDLDRTRPTFGEIVDAYKGDPEQYVRGAGLHQQPACRTLGTSEPLGPTLTCFEQDIDFGASPNLFVNAEGHTLVGALQKSGVYHAVYADTMQEAWTRILSTPFVGGNASSTAVHGGRVFAVVNPGVLFAMDDTTGELVWAAPVGDPFRYQPVSVAGGVVYLLDLAGNLRGYDEATGIPVLFRPMAVDAASPMASISASGVSIARNTVYAAANATTGGFVAGYR